jgi:hypothetical protein
MTRPRKNSRGTASPLTPVDQIARYKYLLDALPRLITERSHLAAATDLPGKQCDELRALLGSDPSPATAGTGPEAAAALARRLGDADARDLIMPTELGTALASRFVASAPVVQYFESGAGSVVIDRQPLWVQELAHHEPNPVDAGTVQHRKSRSMGMWWS